MNPAPPSHAMLLLAVGGSMAGLIWLIARAKVHAFIALLAASIFAGLVAGMAPIQVVQSFQDGIGAMLGSISMVIALGAVMGRLLAASGGADVIARKFITLFGEQNLPWTMLVTGLVVGIPVFFAVGLVLLAPILFTVARSARHPFLQVALPMVAGLSAAHGLVPPHPGPMAAIAVLHADPGKTIIYSLIAGIPAALVAGPLIAPFLTRKIQMAPPVKAATATTGATATTPPSFGAAVTTTMAPVVLMLLSAGGSVILPSDSTALKWLSFIGSPTMAMLIACLIAFWTLGLGRGFSKSDLLKFAEESLGPTAVVLLVVGAGGGFSRVLVNSGIAAFLADGVKSLHLSPILMAWLVAALIRIATGSATVAVTASAGMMSPVLATMPGISVELVVVSMGAGSLVLSHVNDGGFWLVKEYLGLTVAETLKTWTVLETVLSLVGLVVTLLLSLVVSH